MILAEIRAKGWKYATIACSVLAVAAVMAATFLAWRGPCDNARADAAEARADALAAQVEELQEAQYRDEATCAAMEIATE